MPIDPEYLHHVYEGPFPALLYGRNSRDPKKKGRSVEDQLAVGRALCDRYDWPVAKVFKDTGISASRHARVGRDDFEALLDAIRAGEGRIVVAFEASRYYRDLEAYLRLRNACFEAGVLLCYDNQVFDLSKRADRKATARDAIDAEDEAETIRDRNVRTVRLTAEAGKPGGRLPYGYARRYDPDTGDLIEQYPHPVQSKIVLKAMQRVDSGESLYSIVRWLRETPDAARPDGHQWTDKAIRDVLLNPTNLGERVHQGKVIGKATWRPIPGLDEPEGRALFNRVKKILTAPERRTQRDSRVRHLLSRIALCGECGDHAFLAATTRVKGKRYYKCQEAFDTGMDEDRLDAYVEEAVLMWLRDKKQARAALIPDEEETASVNAATQEELNGYRAQLEEARGLARMFENGRPLLSVVSLSGLERDLLPKIEAAEKALEASTGLSPVMQELLAAADPELVWAGVPAADGSVEGGLSVEQKRAVIRQVVTVRLYRASKRGVRALEPGRVQLAFVGQAAFRDRPLRAPVPAPVPGEGTE
ncbi:recombinase family protein [Streptomyces sp. NPDC002573]|uniref:recombinase family protein n=1 Tax=Streptomyces sp. NPDC002573 TaxID=3364651 RepID=UPI0036B2915C